MPDPKQLGMAFMFALLLVIIPAYWMLNANQASFNQSLKQPPPVETEDKQAEAKGDFSFITDSRNFVAQEFVELSKVLNVAIRAIS